MQDLKALYLDGKFELCYEELLRKKPSDQESLDLIYSCEKKLNKHQFEKWNFKKFIREASYKEVLEIFQLHYINFKIQNKVELLLRLQSFGCILEVHKTIENDFLLYLKDRKHGLIEKLLNSFKDEIYKSNEILFNLLSYYLIIGDDGKGFELCQFLCREVESSKLKTHVNQKVTGVDLLIDTIDRVYEITSGEYLKSLQILRYLISLKFLVFSNREVYLRSSLFWIENNKYWKKFEKRVEKASTMIFDNEKTVIMTLESNLYIEGQDISFSDESKGYKLEKEEEDLILRLKHNDSDLEDNIGKLLKTFIELQYYGAIIYLAKKKSSYEYECLYAYWESCQYSKLIDYYENLKLDLRKQVEYKYYAAKAWHALGKKELASKYYKDILIKDRLFRDVEVYWRNVQDK